MNTYEEFIKLCEISAIVLWPIILFWYGYDFYKKYKHRNEPNSTIQK